MNKITQKQQELIINLYCHLNIIVRRHIFDWTFQINVTSYELRPMDCLWQRFANGFEIVSGFSFCFSDSALVWHNRINQSSPKIFSIATFFFPFWIHIFIFVCVRQSIWLSFWGTRNRKTKKYNRSPKLKNIGKDQRIISMNRLMYLFNYFIYSDGFGWSVALGSFVQNGWSHAIYFGFFFSHGTCHSYWCDQSNSWNSHNYYTVACDIYERIFKNFTI